MKVLVLKQLIAITETVDALNLNYGDVDAITAVDAITKAAVDT